MEKTNEHPNAKKKTQTNTVRFQDDSMTALVSANMIDSRSVLILVVVLVCDRIVELVVGHPRSFAYGPQCTGVSLPGPTGVLRCQAGWHRKQSVNPYCCGLES